MGRQVVSCQPAISIWYLRRSCFRKKSLNVSLRRSVSDRVIGRLRSCPTFASNSLGNACYAGYSNVAQLYHHWSHGSDHTSFSVSLVFPRSPSPNTGDLPSRGPSPLFSRDGTGRESSLSTRKEKVLITCVAILYSPIIMQSVEGQACPDATHFLMAGTQVCNTTVYAYT